MKDALRKLLPLSTIITPNITEACILSGTAYSRHSFDENELIIIAEKLRKLGAENIVITGIERKENICNFIYQSDGSFFFSEQPCTGTPHAGTGDVFASVIAADAVNGVPFVKSVEKAAGFVGKAIELSDEMSVPVQDGVCFEEILGTLIE